MSAAKKRAVVPKSIFSQISENEEKLNGGKTSETKHITDWVRFYEPKTIDDLAIHAKKLKELTQWLEDCNKRTNAKRNAKICLITGPSGSGKTAALRCLAAANKFQIHEWLNPLDQDVFHKLGDQATGEAYAAPQLDVFKGFLLRASRYKSLFEPDEKRLLLVEDFPNVLLRNPSAFSELLRDYLDYGKSPMVFIVSDSSSRALNISYNLFSDDVKQQFQIVHISFNPIANTLMSKAMKRFMSLISQAPNARDSYKVPSQCVVDSIMLTAQGDIRNAMTNFHFATLKGAPDVLTTELPATKNEPKKARSKMAQKTLKSVGRDENITMPHALGRVFNPKYTDGEKLLHNPEAIADSYSSEPKKFVDFMHANYLPHFREVEDVVAAIDDLSRADVILQEYRSDSLATTGLNIAIRSIMLANRKPVTAWCPLRGPKRYTPNVTRPTALVGAGISKRLYMVDYGGYVRLINATPN